MISPTGTSSDAGTGCHFRLQMQNQQRQNSTINRAPSCVFVDAWTDYFQKLRNEGKALYFVSFTYIEANAVPLTPAMATKNLRQVDRELRKYLYRKTGRSSFKKIQPSLFCFLDVPGSKPKHYLHGGAPKHESTYHHHCIVVVDERHIPKLDALTDEMFAEVFVEKTKSRTYLRTIHVRRIDPTREDIRTVVDYSSYWSRKRPYDDPDAFQVLGS